VAKTGWTVKAFRRTAAAVVLALGAGALATMPAGAQSDPTAKVGDNYFKPKKLTVTAGDKVTWKWVGSALHDVVVKKGPQKFKSKKQADGKYSKVLLQPGTYRIVCTLHPGMEMKLTVEPAPSPTTVPTTAPPAT
jgi:plastocyanin